LGCQASAADAHVEGAACLGRRDTPTQQAGSVFAGEGNQLSGAVENRNCHRGKVAALGVRKGVHHNGAGRSQGDHGAPRIRYFAPPNNTFRFYLIPNVVGSML
jgi:hypothetical protein